MYAIYFLVPNKGSGITRRLLGAGVANVTLSEGPPITFKIKMQKTKTHFKNLAFLIIIRSNSGLPGNRRIGENPIF